uniref:Photosystem II Psb31 protein domain-containing protein n=1 Tax=Helicotheca tamesis TaxID=374047 RepID=A0A7S2IG61_9STRA|mmetsp:Transcript_9125/g.12677  ORF Transcript_9125/g.12677 Transcript_9125/m.12677 type:complete len:184 (+) Transcript_9125:137-688(+)|eukprot:CAMPEP_0185725082 /NCGR_PEP_ID=MMETSP1171-20130828/1394_1 /TAXON_ID=374046 /ORGANISM="Helicotheca tamensis, Strain CCMP826" /LENGTH=183 /DNA_ID=CAMNT_0028393101 /DNA_START=111 /DNA_END=662 /DNA_ORIENTATION=+
MKLSLVLCAVAASTAAAFAPSSVERASTALNMDRRAAFGQIGAAAAAIASVPAVANADGAVSAATVGRARGIYGGRIAALEGAVASGDFGAVAAEKNAFILFNSGAYPGAKNKANKAAAIEGTNSIFAAIRSKDSAALKSAYKSYIAANDISALPAVDANSGQGYCSDYDYRVRTDAGAIYVR